MAEELRSPLTAEEFTLVKPLFVRTISEACGVLSINPSTAMILLVKYNWNLASLVADFESVIQLLPLLKLCPLVIEATVAIEGSACLCCHVTTRSCHQLNCGHHICVQCILGSVATQLTMRNFLICPDLHCNYFVNYTNLPECSKNLYLRSLLEDYRDKTLDRRSSFAKCVGMAWSHKKKVITCFALAAVGFCVYKANVWEKDNPIKAYLLRLGIAKLC